MKGLLADTCVHGYRNERHSRCRSIAECRPTRRSVKRCATIPCRDRCSWRPSREHFRHTCSAGWYSHTVEDLAGKQVVDSTTSRRVGTHAGFGAEVRMGKRAAFHADYRYTFLRFGGSDPINSDTIAGAIAKSHLTDTGSEIHFLPSYQGSMWTTGITFYF